MLDFHDKCEIRTSLIRNLEQIYKAQDGVLAIFFGITGTQFRQAFLTHQCRELCPGEVFGEPAREFFTVDHLRGQTVRELWPACHIGGSRNLVLVTNNQNSIFGEHQVGFNSVGTLANGRYICGSSVLGVIATGSAVGNNQGAGCHDFSLAIATEHKHSEFSENTVLPLGIVEVAPRKRSTS